MAIKFVYALISCAKDYYTEQAVISMHSLRRHNPDAHITLVSDDETLNTLTGNRSLIRDYVSEYVVVNPPAGFSPVQRSRYIKTSLRQSVQGDFLYMDNDTIVTDSLQELDDWDGEFGAVQDRHESLETNGQLKKYLATTQKEFWNYDYYFNGGVLLVKDTAATHRLFGDWHRIWNEERVKYGLNIDQPSFAQANVANNFLISELSGIYNCQIISTKSVRFMFAPKIVHYHSNLSSDFGVLFPLNDAAVLNTVREQGITPEIEDIIQYPLASYLERSCIIGGEELRIYKSPIVVLARKLSRDFSWTNKVARLVYRLFGFHI